VNAFKTIRCGRRRNFAGAHDLVVLEGAARRRLERPLTMEIWGMRWRE